QILKPLVVLPPSIANRSAAEIVDLDEGRIAGLSFAQVLPEAQALFAAASQPPYDVASGQITLEREGLVRTLNVRIVSDDVEGERSFVATFDDITQLISAQRSAAWGDIARRIAHEIKNPLTPIQLSAERLRRKYLGEIQSAPEVFDKCTETIIRHVGDIGRMVDEFSSFARMPKPVMANEEIKELVRTAVFSQRVASPDIVIDIELPAEPVSVKCDGRLIAQALGNILKNAAESVAARFAADPDGPKGRILVSIEKNNGAVKIAVADNGVGLPKAERHRLTEPYMTTRAKGTGLGLAIVKKVIEEHDGALMFDDCDLLGPTGAVVSVTLPAAASDGGFVAIAAAE
ncbi:MAG TPA: ATP-binding protein, partial [Parvularculaceae bacterium]|nr:ATP-binding protein [Parvularculaceae bacterium]